MLTITIFKAALDDGVINVGKDLILMQLLPKTNEAHLLPGLAAVDLVGGGLFQTADLDHLPLDSLKLLGTVLLQYAAGLLEALIG